MVIWQPTLIDDIMAAAKQDETLSLGILPVEHEVTHVHYINAGRALEVERPTYYVERDLGEALVRTDVPLDL